MDMDSMYKERRKKYYVYEVGDRDEETFLKSIG